MQSVTTTMSPESASSASSASIAAVLSRHVTSTTLFTLNKTRPRTFAEKQPYIFAYGAAISLVSPAATAYQLCRLYKVSKPPSQLIRMSMSIFPHQTLLKALQMNCSTPVKEYLNPWAAFCIMGILQGGVYGQANVHFSKVMALGTTAASITGIFRGSAFAGSRDMLSQGLPFMCSGAVRSSLLDPLYPTNVDDDTNAFAITVKHWTSLLSTSVVATYLSQGLHNCQIAMQADQSLSYRQVLRKVWTEHGFAVCYKGAEARVGLLLVVNVLNELLLKPAWAPVPMQ
jgi:hypothetical protein